ncbi:MAG: gamma-glutamylcyclotransferase family protein [Pseudomonadota bacterium]
MFFYGSLRDRELLDVVLGRAVPVHDFVAAEVSGMAARCLATEAYPVLVPAPGQTAEGRVLYHVTPEDLARLEFFEEAEYGLVPISVRTSQGLVEAQYFCGTGKAAETDTAWDFDAWNRVERPVALAAAREYMGYFGRMTIEEVDAIWPDIMARARAQAAMAEG